MSTPQQPAASAQTANSGKRKRMMTLLVIVILIAAIAYGLYYFLVARFHESTDDAYVNGNVVQITPQVTGHRGQCRRHPDRQGGRPGRRAGPG
jgi:membrane fusion protein (multidrug efflux system)